LRGVLSLLTVPAQIRNRHARDPPGLRWLAARHIAPSGLEPADAHRTGAANEGRLA
jgi:hypothetical protein